MGAVAASRPSPLGPGYCLDRYELLCPLAEGGMASVWLARLIGKHGFEKHVAIKTILPEFASDDRFRRMFLDEARIASRIDHTNVVHILDLGEQHEMLYLVMEYVDGDSLSRLYRSLGRSNTPLPHNILLRIVADACGGLHAAHELTGADGKPLGVVHRDVSPQNILISSLGVSKIIDFGIAKARDSAGGDSHSGLLKGKINYMAPEQATGNPVDRRTDVFAMGALLYHLLTGKPPFEGETQLATLHKLTSKQPAATLPKSVPPNVAAVVRRALARNPADRFSSAAELQAAIEAAMVESRLLGRGSSSTADVSRFVKEHMGERAAKRKEAIELALSAATERQRIREKLRPPMADASLNGVENANVNALSSFGAMRAMADSSPGTASASGVVPTPPAIEDVIDVDIVEQQTRGRRVRLAVIVVVAMIVAALGTLALQAITKTPTPTRVVLQGAPTPPKPVATTAGTSRVAPSLVLPTGSAVDVDDLPKVPTAAPFTHVKPVATPEASSSGHHRENYGF